VVACGGSSGGNIPSGGAGGPNSGLATGADVGPGGRSVGATCGSNVDCTQMCATGGDCPMCTMTCRSDLDCPAGTSCVDENGGICAINCHVSADCAGLPHLSRCHDVDRQGVDGKAFVCRKD